MALTTRLEFRQSQALVMTPQLMQAIKLLQLSNLDLLAYVEEELEKNPLLERAAEDDGPRDSGRCRMACRRRCRRRTARARPNGWATNLATSRNAIEDQLGTRLDNVFPEDGGSAVASARNEDATAAAFGMGERRFRRPRRRRL